MILDIIPLVVERTTLSATLIWLQPNKLLAYLLTVSHVDGVSPFATVLNWFI